MASNLKLGEVKLSVFKALSVSRLSLPPSPPFIIMIPIFINIIVLAFIHLLMCVGDEGPVSSSMDGHDNCTVAVS